MSNWFKVDGRAYNIRVFEPEESFSILYSENTGRTLDAGTPIILDPLGTFFNYTLTVGKKPGAEADFEALWEKVSTPTKSGMSFAFPKSSNEMWDPFQVYVSSGKRGIKRIIEDANGDLKEVVYESFSINFIAMKAQVTPE